MNRDYRMLYTTIIKKKHKGELAFVCPECSSIHYAGVKISAQLFDLNSGTDSLEINVKIKCRDCHKTFVTNLSKALDPDIAQFIVALNKKGYKTTYSCQGHIYKSGEESLSYVTFEESLSKDKLSELPATWRADPIDTLTTGTTIRSSISKYGLSTVMEDLGKWINKLPDNCD